VLSGVTGRASADLERTAEFRTQGWETALLTWSEAPLLGHGPGQSAVQLAGPPAPYLAAEFRENTIVLGTARGLWAASLIDAGVTGLAAWVVFLGLVLTVAARQALQRDWLTLGLLAAVMASLIGSQISGDRMELTGWALLAALTAAVCQPPATDAGKRDGEPDASPDGG
jgi:O-antigen ligase